MHEHVFCNNHTNCATNTLIINDRVLSRYNTVVFVHLFSELCTTLAADIIMLICEVTCRIVRDHNVGLVDIWDRGDRG